MIRELGELLREARDGLGRHRVRSLLSTLGMLFGVAAVLAILAIGEGARREQETLISRLGILDVHLRNRDLGHDQKLQDEVRRISAGLAVRDVEALRAELTGTRVGAAVEHTVWDWVPRPLDPTRVALLGADPDWLAGSNLALQEGRPLGPADERAAAAVCVIGSSARDQLFGGSAALGQRVRVNGAWFTVVGVFEDGSGDRAVGGRGVDTANRNGTVVIPLNTSLRRLGPDRSRDYPVELSDVQITVASMGAVEGVAAVAERAMRRLHRNQPDFQVVVPLRLLEASQAQQRLFDLVMGLIAGISLLVGGIGIMNIMLASVLERTREIGIRLAVGARPRDVAALFLAEAALLSLVGGALGIGAGLALARLVAASTGWSTAVTPQAIALVTALSMAEGVVFGFLPARRAAQLPPVIAVRG